MTRSAWPTLTRLMRGALVLGAIGASNTWAAWVRLGDVYGNADVYYDNQIDNTGKNSVIRTFMALPVRSQAPIFDPKLPLKVRLVIYRSELSSYEFDCKNQTVQLAYRVFYEDVDGKIPLITHKAKDEAITQSNSSFAMQFAKKSVYPNNYQAVKLMGLACK